MDFIEDILSNLNKPGNLIFITIIGIFLWLVTREIRCWYWRINELLTEHKKQNELLQAILNKMQDAGRGTQSDKKEQ